MGKAAGTAGLHHRGQQKAGVAAADKEIRTRRSHRQDFEPVGGAMGGLGHRNDML